jgi:hypothetical protein
MTQSANAENAGEIKISKGECVSRLSGDIKDINALPEKSSSIDALNVLSNIYSYCAFYFQKKDIFYSYMRLADDIAIMATQLELSNEGVISSKYSEDKNKVINTLDKLIATKL